MLEELALSPLQVFWWQQTGTQLLLVLVIPFFIPFSIYDIHDGFHVGHGATDFSSSSATCLQSVGWSMPCESGVVPVMEVAAIVEALRKHLQGTHSHAQHCPRAAPAAGVFSCTSISALDLLASVGGTVNYLFLVDAFNVFKLQAWFSHSACLLSLVAFAASQGLTEYAGTVVALLLLMNYTWFINAQLFSHLGNNMQLCLHQTLTL